MAVILSDLPTEAEVLKIDWTVEHLFNYVRAMIAELFPILRGSYKITMEDISASQQIKITLPGQNIWLSKSRGEYVGMTLSGTSWHIPVDDALARLCSHLGPIAAREWLDSRYNCTA